MNPVYETQRVMYRAPMPPTDTVLPAYVWFWLVVLGAFVAYLWFGCGLRNLGLEEREKQRQLRELDKQHEGRHFDGSVVIARIRSLRVKDGASVQQQRDSSCLPETHFAIRKAIASASFFRRRRKVEDSEQQ